ncbi:MAG TPA: 2-isopropylmalate synthase [Candidatus Salinicoccus merdavium]|nr:2-isopropylmalate synthase [Candidatus Salinicoccus merdavium]
MADIQIFDTTLRDGEQSPGVNLNKSEKLEIAKQLERLGVDIIEAGFPAASDGDFEAVKLIADTVKNSSVTALARTHQKDIDRAYEALKNTAKPRIHIFLATSPIHMKYKLKMSEEEVLAKSVEMVTYAKTMFPEVEFSAEDATRSDIDFLTKLIEKVIDAGATVINLPDTVGFTTPQEYGQMFKTISENVPNIDKVHLSCHCHDDLGMAVANSIAAVENGATQVECAVNGIGERAGNAALEEIAVALEIRKDFYPYETSLVLKEIKRTSDLVSKLSGMYIQANKAVIGRNAYAHESGIHQDGVLKNAETYEIITPELVGVSENTLFLGKHSGRHAFKDKVAEFKLELTEDEITTAFKKFKLLTDQKKEVTEDDIYTILMEIKTEDADIPMYKMENFQVNYGPENGTESEVSLRTPAGKTISNTTVGNGSVDALYGTIKGLIDMELNLIDYQLNSVGRGKDALAEAHVQLKVDGQVMNGRGTAQDVIEASANAYINAVNRYLIKNTQEKSISISS